MRKLFALISATAVIVGLMATFTSPVSATSTAGFSAGNIMDNPVMTDSKSMTAAQIQTFLNSKVPNCDTNGTQPATEFGYPNKTHAQYAAMAGWPGPPYTCLKNYTESGQTAAQIIYNLAQQYQINPQVLIVTLQKESSLVTDTWPLPSQYKTATGYGCPDSGPNNSANCSTKYYGLTNQLTNTAYMYHAIMTQNPNWYSPYIVGTNYIQWNPSTSCGGSNVNIKNLATAALYDYTPYQPNAAALAAGYGTGNSCSAYGNRNFYLYFTDWFGSTQGTPFFQFPGSPSTYMIGSNNNYYSISDYQRLRDYGFENDFKYRVDVVDKSYVSGMTYSGNLPPIARFEGIGVYIADLGSLHPFPTESMMTDFGYTMGQEATLPGWVLSDMTTSSAVANVVRPSDSATVYYVTGGKKEPFCTWDAFTSLGSPTYVSQNSVYLRSYYTNTISDGMPLAVSGALILNRDTGQYGLWQNGALSSINKQIAQNSGAVNCAASNTSFSQLPTSGATVSNLVKDGSGNQYIVDTNKKLALSSATASNIGISASQYTSVDPAFLSRIPTATMTNLIRIGSNPGVSLVQGGKQYAVPSQDDLLGLGYNFNQVTSVNSTTSSTIASGGYIFKPGRLVRAQNTNGVYLLDSSFGMHPFTSESALFNYGKTWSDVVVIPSAILSAYTQSTPAATYIKENDSLYWLMNNGVKYRIPTNLIGSSYYNITSQNSVTLPTSILTQYPMSSKPLGTLIQATGGRGVYLVQNGKKSVFASEQAMFSRGYSWSDVQVLSPYVVDSIPDGPPLY